MTDRKPRRRWVVWLRRTTLGLLALIVVVVAGAAAWLRLSVPEHGGTAPLAGLAAPVTVYRDADAVPHVFADGMADAYRALGYLHAQDRFFQMEMMRRLGAGRLAELIGRPALRFDRVMRTLGLYRLAAAQVAAAPPDVRAAIDAYVAGVNAYLGSGAARPPELVALGVTPEPWNAADSMVWGKLMALQLSGNWREELYNARLAARLTRQQIADLSPPDDGDAPATLPDLTGLGRDADLERLASVLDGALPVASASNAWVLDGQATASGAPILANDPHLGFTAPGMWYLARLVTPELTLVGVTVPGVPFLVLGHNGHIAWGLTTTHSDTQDLFIERIDANDPSRYLTPDGPRPFATRVEQMRVRGSDAPETLTVRATRHGPVISDVDRRTRDAAGTGQVLALAFPALEEGDRTPTAIYRLNRARSWQDFVAAMALFDAPQQNVFYADAGGTIGFYAPAQVPIRPTSNGLVPVPGWTGAYDWDGFVPFDELPHAVAPLRGRIVNGNNRIVGPDYRHRLAAHWPAPFRARRIHDSLDATEADGGRHDVAGSVRLQLDTASYAARDVLPLLLDLAGEEGAPGGARIAAALALLRDWDGTMQRDLPQPLIFHTWLRELDRRLTADELGDAHQASWEPNVRALQRMLTVRQVWCDDVTTSVAETCPMQVAGALGDAVALLNDKLGGEPDDWRWGELHRARFGHQVLTWIPVARDLVDIVVETDGGPFTVNRGTANMGDRGRLFEHRHGAGYRAVYDLGDLANSRYMIATGQSGHPLSPHFDDLTPRWADGDSRTLTGDRVTLAAEAVSILKLTPAAP